MFIVMNVAKKCRVEGKGENGSDRLIRGLTSEKVDIVHSGLAMKLTYLFVS